MTEAEAIVMRLDALPLGRPIPHETRLEIGALALKLRKAQWSAPPARFAQIGPWLFRFSGKVWRTPSAGPVALALAVAAPGRWVRLPSDWDKRSIKAWNRSIADAVKFIRDIDPPLATAMTPARGGELGIHLRKAGHDVEIRLHARTSSTVAHTVA